LLELVHHRWALPILAEIDRTRGSRFATLTGRVGVSSESLRRTLAALVELGLVRRNPGYGHPLRPEYMLTARGRALAPGCSELLVALRGNESVGLRKWSLPILAELDEPRRFSELRARLPAITPRALALALRALEGTALVERTVTEAYPPAVSYAPTPAAEAIVHAARRLATRGRRPRP
jgi:DNA-binding HxlR family transcriptional regulator